MVHMAGCERRNNRFCQADELQEAWIFDFFFFFPLGKIAYFSWREVTPTAAVSGVCVHVCEYCKVIKYWTVTECFLRSNQTKLASQIAGWSVWVENGSSVSASCQGSLMFVILSLGHFCSCWLFPAILTTNMLGHFQNVIMIKLVTTWWWINTSGYLFTPIIIKKNSSSQIWQWFKVIL